MKGESKCNKKSTTNTSIHSHIFFLFSSFSQALEVELKAAQKTKDTEIQKVTNYYTAALDTIKMKLEDERINAVKEVEMKSQMREEFFRNQVAEFSNKEAQYLKGSSIYMHYSPPSIRLSLLSFSFFFSFLSCTFSSPSLLLPHFFLPS
jgi:hypothetical protein